MQGCFEVKENTEAKYDINCAIIGKYSNDKICDEQLKVYTLIEEMCSTIKALEKTDENIKDNYFKKVLSAAQVGLAGSNAHPELALESLNSIKDDIVLKEGGRIKNEYMISLGKSALVIIIIALIIIGVMNYFEIYLFEKYFYTFIGAMLGTWISFGARKVELKFEDLSMIEKDRLNPIVRLAFVGITSNILLLFISSGIVDFSIGGLGTEDILISTELQILVGVVSGLIEYKLAIGLFNKANDIIKL